MGAVIGVSLIVLGFITSQLLLAGLGGIILALSVMDD